MAVEDVLLALAIRKSQSDMLSAARKQATIDASRAALEREVAERQRTERLLSLQYVITRVLAGAQQPARRRRRVILRIMGENQGWHVGELWEVDEGRQCLRCVDIWHTDDFRDADYLDSGGALHDRARRRAGRAGLAAPPAALDPGPGRGADVADWRCSPRRFGPARRRSRSRCATAPR